MRKSLWASMSLAFGILLFQSFAAHAQFYVIPVGGARIHYNNVIELSETVTGATPVDVWRVMRDGTRTTGFTVPNGKKLVLVSVILYCVTPSASPHAFDLYQYTGGPAIPRGHWVFNGNETLHVNLAPGLIIETGHTVRVSGDAINVQNVTGTFYGYLINN